MDGAGTWVAGARLGWEMVVEQLCVPPLPSQGASSRCGPASTGERAGSAHLLVHCSLAAVAACLESTRQHTDHNWGFTCSIKSNDHFLLLNHTRSNLNMGLLPFAAAKGSYLGEHK